jgi:hypothetical protein
MNLFKTRLPLFPIWPEVVSLDGMQVPVKSSPLDPKTRRRLMRGLYETSERDLIQQFIRPGDQILELGASVGIVSSFLAKRAGPTGRLVSVEADGRLEHPFRKQLALNGLAAGWVHALACPIWSEAVPDATARQSFARSERTLSGRAAAAVANAEPGPVWLTAGAVCRQQKLAPTALVVDIEGSESVWVEHRPQFPPSLRTIIAEFHPHLIGSRIAGAAIQRLLEEGFAVAGLHSTVLALERK